MKKILFIANNNLGYSQSGGDTIFINFIKYWRPKLDISILGSQETRKLLRSYKILTKYHFIETDSTSPFTDLSVLSLIYHNIRRIYRGIITLFTLYSRLSLHDYVYTVSDFYPDLLPGFFLKIFNHHIKWIAGYYLIVPHPSDPNSPYSGQKVKSWFYYLSQKISLLIVNHFADYVFITSDPDKKYFPNKNIIVVQGGVDIPKRYTPVPLFNRGYDAVFVGRLHPQKGVSLLPEIWEKVVQQKPQAKLAIIGDGQLQNELENEIFKRRLNHNINLFGVLTGKAKYSVFKNSKVFLHPATFDSGGMSAAEAMAWGLPVISFDLESLKTYYPSGSLKTPCFDTQVFADNIIKLLDDSKLYSELSNKALLLVKNHWSWPKRSSEVLNTITLCRS